MNQTIEPSTLCADLFDDTQDALFGNSINDCHIRRRGIIAILICIPLGGALNLIHNRIEVLTAGRFRDRESRTKKLHGCGHCTASCMSYHKPSNYIGAFKVMHGKAHHCQQYDATPYPVTVTPNLES